MRRAALVLGGTILVAPSARALDVGSTGATVDVTSTTVGSYHTDNDNNSGCDDNYIDVFERLNVVGRLAPWSAGLRLDGSYFSSIPEDGEGSPACSANPELFDRYLQEVIPEKVWIAYSGRRIEATVGDSYVQFGRGLALSLRKVDELGVDTSLRGGKVLARLGPLNGTLAAGVTNVGNVDEATGRHATDPNDAVVGTRVEVEAGRFRPGAHAVLLAFRDRSNASTVNPDDYKERWISVGPTLDAPRLLPFLGVYLEGIHQRRDFGEGATQTGNGAYGTITSYHGPATLLIEGKAYGSLAVVQPDLKDAPTASGLPQEFNALQYTAPPTVERVTQRIYNPQSDIAGARTQLDWRFTPSVSAFASYGAFRDDYEIPGTGLPSSTIHDPYAGVDLRWNDARSRALISAGQRFTLIDTPSMGTGRRLMDDLHADAEVSQALTRTLSAEVRWQHLEREELVAEFREGSIQAGVKLAPWVGASAILDYSTEFATDKDGFGDFFPGGVLDVAPTPSSNLRLFAGASRGGLRCVSGVCRTFPPFEGVKLTATLRF